MMPSALSRICRSASAIGPFGSSTPSVQPPSDAAPIRATASRPYRMLYLAEVDGVGCATDGAWQESRSPVVDQESGKQHEQIEDGESEQPMSGAAIVPSASVQLEREQNENCSAGRDDRAIERARKTKRPGQLRG